MLKLAHALESADSACEEETSNNMLPVNKRIEAVKLAIGVTQSSTVTSDAKETKDMCIKIIGAELRE
jgi:hypothetical protein